MSGARTLSPALVLHVTMTLGLMSCQGQEGPIGPTGPSLRLRVEWQGDPPRLLRADGVSTAAIRARVTTPDGNRVAGVPVYYALTTGSGTLSSQEVTSDSSGEVLNTYTAGNVAGHVAITTWVTRGELEISDVMLFYLDPLNLSTPLLPAETDRPLRAAWSPDGVSISFAPTSMEAELSIVSALGGTPQIVGAYGGGSWRPNGTDELAVFTNTEIRLVDRSGAVLLSRSLTRTKCLAWSRQGDSLFVGGYRGSYLFSGNLDSLNTYSLSAVSVSLATETGEFFTSEYDEEPDLRFYKLDLATDRRHVVPDAGENLDGWLANLSADPLGRWLMFSAQARNPDWSHSSNDLYRLSTSTGENQRIFESPYHEHYPALSPDGTRVVFSSDRSGAGYNLYVWTLPDDLR